MLFVASDTGNRYGNPNVLPFQNYWTRQLFVPVMGCSELSDSKVAINIS